MSLGNYCPYTNGNVVYLKCQECEDRICEKDWFFCGVAGTSLSMTKSRMQMSEYLDKILAKREKVVIAAESGKKMTLSFPSQTMICSHTYLNSSKRAA